MFSVTQIAEVPLTFNQHELPAAAVTELHPVELWTNPYSCVLPCHHVPFFGEMYSVNKQQTTTNVVQHLHKQQQFPVKGFVTFVLPVFFRMRLFFASAAQTNTL